MIMSIDDVIVSVYFMYYIDNTFHSPVCSAQELASLSSPVWASRGHRYLLPPPGTCLAFFSRGSAFPQLIDFYRILPAHALLALFASEESTEKRKMKCFYRDSNHRTCANRRVGSSVTRSAVSNAALACTWASRRHPPRTPYAHVWFLAWPHHRRYAFFSTGRSNSYVDLFFL